MNPTDDQIKVIKFEDIRDEDRKALFSASKIMYPRGTYDDDMIKKFARENKLDYYMIKKVC